MMGSPDIPKENIELSMGSTTIIIDNFQRLQIIKKGARKKTLKLSGKGHKEQLDFFQKSIKTGSQVHPSAADGVRATACAIAALQSMKTGSMQMLDQSLWLAKGSL